MRCILVIFCLQCSCVFANTDGDCRPSQRISDEEAVKLVKTEMRKRVKEFDTSKYEYSVVEEACDLRVNIEKKRETAIGKHSVMVLSRAGKVKRYFGGM